MVIDGDRLRLLEGVALAARAYREAMRCLIRAQSNLLDDGVPFDEVTGQVADRFADLADAEDMLDDALVVLAWYDASARRP